MQKTQGGNLGALKVLAIDRRDILASEVNCLDIVFLCFFIGLHIRIAP